MGVPLPDEELVVATPERVSFDYAVAGLGTRAIAQLLDLLIVLVVLLAVIALGLALGAVGGGTLAILLVVIGSFAVIFGYFWASETFWSGQTVGKRVFRLRAVGDRGEPLTFIQAGVRNIVRIVDFLPYGYGVGMVVLFANGKGKRLGDLAAGTMVVKDSDYVQLWQLQGARPEPPPPPDALPGSAAVPPAITAGELVLRRLDPDLRRFVSSYARRRSALSFELRAMLAAQLQPALRTAAPELFAEQGPLAALDRLADLERQ